MAQNADIAVAKAKILRVAEGCAGIVTVGHQYTSDGKFKSFTPDELSAVTVYYTGTTQRAKQTLTLGGGGKRVTRVYDVMRHVLRLPEKPTQRQEMEALEEAEAVVDELPNHFSLHPQLDIDDGGSVFQIGEMTEDGAKMIAYGGVWYASISYKLPVITYL